MARATRALPRPRKGQKRTPLTLLFLLEFSVWVLVLRSAVATDSGDLARCGYGAPPSPSSPPTGAPPPPCLYFLLLISRIHLESSGRARSVPLGGRFAKETLCFPQTNPQSLAYFVDYVLLIRKRKLRRFRSNYAFRNLQFCH